MIGEFLKRVPSSLSIVGNWLSNLVWSIAKGFGGCACLGLSLIALTTIGLAATGLYVLTHPAAGDTEREAIRAPRPPVSDDLPTFPLGQHWVGEDRGLVRPTRPSVTDGWAPYLIASAMIHEGELAGARELLAELPSRSVTETITLALLEDRLGNRDAAIDLLRSIEATSAHVRSLLTLAGE